MLRSGLALAAGALALLVVSSAFEAAEARDRRGGSARAFHGGSYAGGRAFHGRRFHGGQHRFAGRQFHGRRYGRGIGRGFAIGVPLGIYGAYAYTAGCDWLHRKAVITGNPYWWHRYELCLDGGY